MAFNGSGVFNRLYSWVNDAAANIKIRADRMDNEMNGFATGLSTCITKDGQTTITANLPMAGFKHTGVGDATDRAHYSSFGQLQDGKAAWVAAGGTADAITATYTIPIASLVDGQYCFVRASAANATTTPTFSPNALTARTIVKNGGQALAAGDIYGSGHELILRYNLANTRWELLNPAVTAATPVTDATISTSDITTNNASTSKHGWLKKLSGNATDYLGGDGNFTALPAAVTDATITTTDVTTNNASTSKHGWLKKLSGNATDYLGGDGNFTALPTAGSATLLTSGSLSSISTTYQTINLNGTVTADTYNYIVAQFEFSAIASGVYARLQLGSNGTLVTTAVYRAIGRLFNATANVDIHAGASTFIPLAPSITTVSSVGSGRSKVNIKILNMFTTRTNAQHAYIDGSISGDFTSNVPSGIITGNTEVNSTTVFDTFGISMSGAGAAACTYKVWGYK